MLSDYGVINFKNLRHIWYTFDTILQENSRESAINFTEEVKRSLTLSIKEESDTEKRKLGEIVQAVCCSVDESAFVTSP